MTKDFPQIADQLGQAIGELGKGIPEAMQAFASLARAAKADGALDAKTKELIAVAIAIALRCDGCIAFHVKEVLKLGGSRDELLETIAMAVMMGGGPSTVYGAEALTAYDQYADG